MSQSVFYDPATGLYEARELSASDIPTGAITDGHIGLREILDDVAPAQPQGPDTLGTLLGFIANRIAAIMGDATPHWYDTPAVTLFDLSDRVDDLEAAISGDLSVDSLTVNQGLRLVATRFINTGATQQAVTTAMHRIECSTTTTNVVLGLPTRGADNDDYKWIIKDIGRNCAMAGRRITVNTNGTNTWLHNGATTVDLNRNGGMWFVEAVINTAGTRGYDLHVITEGV